MKKHKMQGMDELPLNMMPMIDVVFNLIIFFMIVIDLSQRELEDITLPRASECQEDSEPDEKRKIINVTPDGEMIVMREPQTLDTLRHNLSIWRQLWRRDDEGGGFCSKPVLIRTDRGTQMKHVQKIMQICGEEQLKIYKIELACSKDKAGLNTIEIPGEVYTFEDEEKKE